MDSVTRISLHDYRTDPSLPQKDGVNLAHENIAALMRSVSEQEDPRFQVGFHDFYRLMADDDYARQMLASCDVVIANVGPHAHYYFLIREKLGLKYRIVRDVRTALWTSYLLQEHLCQPYLRHDDVLLAGSYYVRGIYEHVFPHLREFPVIRCYPMTVGFPSKEGLESARHQAGGGGALILGYVGRLSEDKNFPSIIDLLIYMNRHGRPTRLIACGDIHSESCHPVACQQRIAEALGPGDFFEYWPARKNHDIWSVYRDIDVLVFPSVSNLETLGRVVVEASFAGVPVIGGNHAALMELIPANNLCAVEYRVGEEFSTHFDHPLGIVPVEAMSTILLNGQLQVSYCHQEYRLHPEKFLNLLTSPLAISAKDLADAQLTEAQAAFIASLHIDMPIPLTRSEADVVMLQMQSWFLSLQDCDRAIRNRQLEELLSLSVYPERTRRYIEKCTQTAGDFTNVGGIDIELSHIVRFYPKFRMQPCSG
jgi:hypothetical protein